MESILLGLGMLVSYAFWRFIWRRTALDTYRDRLFDLREDVKTYFVTNGYGFDHPLHNELRNLLNGHIRYTEMLTLRLFVAKTVGMSAHPEIAHDLKNQLNSRFVTEDVKLAAYIKDVRDRAVIILSGHMAESSFTFMVFMPFLLGVVRIMRAFSYLAAMLNNNAQRLRDGAKAAMKVAPVAGFMIAVPARAGFIDPALDNSIVEEYSYQATQS